MKLLRWLALLLCLCVDAENIAVWRESGENVTLRCSTARCSVNIKGYDGMYLFHTGHAERKQVLYYHADPTEWITLEDGFKNRTQKEGSLRNHTISISELTVDDSGLYSCVFLRFPDVEARCSVHTLFVRGVAPCSRSTGAPCALVDKEGPSLIHLLIAIVACTVGTLVTLIFILLIVPRVRRWASSRRSVPQQVPNDVYEVMTKNGLHLPREGTGPQD